MKGAREIAVGDANDVILAQQAVKALARTLPFSREDVERLGVAATELASNLIKHAGGGCLEVAPVQERGRLGLRLVARDKGPGIPDLGRALAPGFSTAGSFGDGLATIKEHMDRFVIESVVGEGTRVEVVKWAS